MLTGFRFSQKIFLIHKSSKKILLLKRSEDSYSRPNDWDLPGGGVEKNEDNKESIRREVEEETGLEIISRNEEILPLSVFTNYDEHGLFLSIIYIGYTNRQEIKLSSEHSEFLWLESSDKKLISELNLQYWIKNNLEHPLTKQYIRGNFN